MSVAIHVSHEAAAKIGGIGSVLNGLVSSPSYRARFSRSLIYGPLFSMEGPSKNRLGENSRLLYSSLDGVTPAPWRERFAPLEEKFGLRFVYGIRMMGNEFSPEESVETEILLCDVRGAKRSAVDTLKFTLWESFALPCDRFGDWDFEQYLRLSVPYVEVVEALFGSEPCVHFAHEYMGVPCALAVEREKSLQRRLADKTFFYAHEISPARACVESHPGHDTLFYNLLLHDRREGRSLEERFGSQENSYRSQLVKRAVHMNGVLCVGDWVQEEFLYLCPGADPKRVHTVYNGAPSRMIDFKEKELRRALIKEYGRRLFLFTPDIILTHVARLVVSKGFWRDLRFLYPLDRELAERGLKGIFIILSTLIGTGRNQEEVCRMEEEYGWPLLHRKGWPDLVGAEESLSESLSLFNARSQAIKGVFLNQFGFAPGRSGLRVPQEASFLDLRAASDLEFGLSIYEPFGIAQLEASPFGGVALLSRACGSAFLLEQTGLTETHRIVDFAALPSPLGESPLGKGDLLARIGLKEREERENRAALETAPLLAEDLAARINNPSPFFEKGQLLQERISWERIFREKILPALS